MCLKRDEIGHYQKGLTWGNKGSADDDRKGDKHLTYPAQSINLSTNYPYGRPVYKKISYTELEKMFKRIV